MEQDLATRLNTLEDKLDAVFVSVEKTRKYFLWTMIGTVILFVLPLIGIAFALPSFLNSYAGDIQTLSQ